MHASGYDSSSSILLNRAVVYIIHFLLKSLNTSSGMPSIPGALFFFNAFRAAVISLSTIGSSRMGTDGEIGGL